MRVRGSALAVTVAVLLVIAATASGQAPASTARIAFIDVQRVLARSAAGLAAREQLEREKAGMQKEMDGKRKELETLRDELEKKGPLMTAESVIWDRIGLRLNPAWLDQMN